MHAACLAVTISVDCNSDCPKNKTKKCFYNQKYEVSFIMQTELEDGWHAKDHDSAMEHSPTMKNLKVMLVDLIYIFSPLLNLSWFVCVK